MTASADKRKKILGFLLMSLAGLGILYALLLGMTVWNILERRALEAEIRTLGNEVGELELSYLAAVEKIDPSFSETLGFKEIKPKFVERNAADRLTQKGKTLVGSGI